MRVVHVSHRDAVGGAAIAACALHEQLRDKGVDSSMVVATKRGSGVFVYQPIQGLEYFKWMLKKKCSRALELLQRDRTCHFYSLNIFSSGIVDAINDLKPDIVHLHWIGGEALQIEAIRKIEAPIVWTLHDMWPFCGAEHLNLDVENERWTEGYGKTSRNRKAWGIDWNRRVWERKRKAWNGLRMTAVCPSRWSRDCVERSSLGKVDAFVDSVVIPNSVDTRVFRGVDDVNAGRARFGLRSEAPLLAFGASRLDVPSKGVDLLLDALARLAVRFDFEVVTFGQGQLSQGESYEVVNVGEISKVSDLAQLYACCDLTVMPSLIESFGLVAAESMACGTPVTCFDVGGLKDVVDHKVNGFRAKAFSIDDFVEGIVWCLCDKQRHKALRTEARKKVVSKFGAERVVEEHVALYKRVLSLR